ncbi:hypothetical protein IPJ72_02855 [Candidatus Peregrinibacteria bacterium]|nr:MAG: hypothetical protein IPJ72_02855 [Candidatus Peregrinibacteria bacterium]
MKETTQSSHNRTLLEWHTPEFINHPKSKQWFLTAGVLMILVIGYAIYSNAATTAIVFILLAGVYALTHNQSPKIISVQITELGIKVADRLYAYNMINSFWIVYNPPFVQTLNLKLGNKTSTHLVIQLNEQNPVELRKLLSAEIPEVEGQDERLIDLFIRLLRL